VDVGDADGLGETRKKELAKSGISLGLRQEDDVFVVESPYVIFFIMECDKC
jgi:N-acetylglucosaminylphosphatidylinositol deacetylase